LTHPRVEVAYKAMYISKPQPPYDVSLSMHEVSSLYNSKYMVSLVS